MTEQGMLLQALADYVYALEGKPVPPGQTEVADMARYIHAAAKARRVGAGIPSRDDAGYKWYREQTS